jgi:hypothetical protein
MKAALEWLVGVLRPKQSGKVQHETNKHYKQQEQQEVKKNVFNGSGAGVDSSVKGHAPYKTER